MKRNKFNIKGDTIIEVLISITIAAFAIGSSYAIASKSLQQAISARERDQSLDIMESQLQALKFREQQTDTTVFNNNFSFPKSHFCIDETVTDPTSPNWQPSFNNGNITSDTPLTTGVTPTTYNAKCEKAGKYFVDITTSSVGGKVPTVYKVNVRWDPLGGGPVSESSIYYRF